MMVQQLEGRPVANQFGGHPLFAVPQQDRPRHGGRKNGHDLHGKTRQQQESHAHFENPGRIAVIFPGRREAARFREGDQNGPGHQGGGSSNGVGPNQKERGEESKGEAWVRSTFVSS